MELLSVSYGAAISPTPQDENPDVLGKDRYPYFHLSRTIFKNCNSLKILKITGIIPSDDIFRDVRSIFRGLTLLDSGSLSPNSQRRALCQWVYDILWWTRALKRTPWCATRCRSHTRSWWSTRRLLSLSLGSFQIEDADEYLDSLLIKFLPEKLSLSNCKIRADRAFLDIIWHNSLKSLKKRTIRSNPYPRFR